MSSEETSENKAAQAGLRDLLVHLDGTAEDETRIAHAEAIAAKADAHLTGIFTNLLPDYGMMAAGDVGGAGAAAMLELEERMRSKGSETLKRLSGRFRRLGVRNALRRIDRSAGGLAGAVASEARWSDLLIATCPYRDTLESNWDDVLEAVLFEGGHGLYCVPPGARPRSRLTRVVVAWTDTREAARAVSEALPFLRAANDVQIVTVEDHRAKHATAGHAASDIAAHLDRHGVTVTIRPADAGVRSVGDTLLGEASRMSADLIVMGGYGHSRWREWIMGGTTREMLAAAEVPVLVAH